MKSANNERTTTSLAIDSSLQQICVGDARWVFLKPLGFTLNQDYERIYNNSMEIFPRIFKLLLCYITVLFAFEKFAVAQTNAISFTNRDGTVYENVILVKIDASGLVYRSPNGAGGGRVKLSELPDDLLQKYGFDPRQAKARDKEQSAHESQRQLEAAIAAGLFREVEGIVYDMRQNQPGWVYLRGAKLFQQLERGDALVDPNPRSYGSDGVVHVKHMPLVSDTEFVTLLVRPVGTYTYINKADYSRSVRSYDSGRICTKEEIPEQVLAGKAAFGRIRVSSKSLDEIIPSSEADSLVATGTGFFITDDGYLVTNNHVVNGAKKVRIRVGSTTVDAKVIKTSRAFDLALIKAEGSFKSLPLDSDRHLNLGDSVFTIGFPNIEVQGAAPKYTDGKISSLSGLEDDPSQYQITVPIQPGNSGGPLVAENGTVIGIVRAKLNDMTALATSGAIPQNVNYAVKVKYLHDLLESVPNIAPKLKKPSSNDKPQDSVKKAQDSVVIVLVY